MNTLKPQHSPACSACFFILSDLRPESSLNTSLCWEVMNSVDVEGSQSEVQLNRCVLLGWCCSFQQQIRVQIRKIKADIRAASQFPRCSTQCRSILWFRMFRGGFRSWVRSPPADWRLQQLYVPLLALPLIILWHHHHVFPVVCSAPCRNNQNKKALFSAPVAPTVWKHVLCWWKLYKWKN